VAKEQLNRPEVSGPPVDQGRLGSTQRMSAEQRRVKTDAGDPLRQQAGILAGGEATTLAATATKEEVAGSLLSRRNVLIDRLARLLGDLESDRKTGLVLPNGRTVDSIAMWCDVFDLEPHDVAATWSFSPSFGEDPACSGVQSGRPAMVWCESEAATMH
jgi:hypothetical protein